MSTDSMFPLVSIIIPTYNRAHLINETLDSIIAQTYTHWECIVVDDGSTDDTEELINSYIKKETRFQYHKRPNDKAKGANACRNYGFELSKGKYIKWFDSDDIMLPDFLQKQTDFLDKNSSYDFVAAFGEEFRVKNGVNVITHKLQPKVTASTAIFHDYAVGNIHFMTPAPLWRKTFLQDKDLFNLKMHRSQEAEFNFRMLLQYPKFKYLDDCGFQVRRGHDSIDTQSGVSLKAQQSVAYYYNKMFQELLKREFAKKRETLQYIFFRQAVNVYTIVSFGKNKKERMQHYNKLPFRILDYAKSLNLGVIDKIKLKIGLFTTKTFGKGYQLLYFKKMDCRK